MAPADAPWERPACACAACAARGAAHLDLVEEVALAVLLVTTTEHHSRSRRVSASGKRAERRREGRGRAEEREAEHAAQHVDGEVASSDEGRHCGRAPSQLRKVSGESFSAVGRVCEANTHTSGRPSSCHSRNRQPKPGSAEHGAAAMRVAVLGLALCPLASAAAVSTALAAFALSTSQIGPDGLPSSLVPDASPAAGQTCAACGKNSEGKGNCCSTGGSWAGKCSESLSAEHTWKEGFSACNQAPPGKTKQDVALEAAAARRQYNELKCEDKEADCNPWATTGECSNNPGFMLDSCCKSCVQLDFQAFKKAGRESPSPEPPAEQAKAAAQPPPQQASAQEKPAQEKPMTLGTLGTQPKKEESSKPMTLGSLGKSQQQEAKIEGFQQEAIGGDHEAYTPRAAPTTSAAEDMTKDEARAAAKGSPVAPVAHAPAPGKIILKAKNNRFDGRFEDLEGELKHACTEVEAEELYVEKAADGDAFDESESYGNWASLPEHKAELVEMRALLKQGFAPNGQK